MPHLPSENILWVQVYSPPIYLSSDRQVLPLYVKMNALPVRSRLVGQA